MLIIGLQRVTLLDYPGTAFPLRGRGPFAEQMVDEVENDESTNQRSSKSYVA